MTSIIIDWQRENTTEIMKNHLKFNPLDIRAKDGSSCEMDARIILEIADDSVIVQNFGSLPVLVDKILNKWIRNYFTYKEMKDVLSNRLILQEELVGFLQERLKMYGMKVTAFTIVYTSISSSVPENPYRKALADMYVEQCMGKPGDEATKNAVNGNNEDLSLDYYLGAEKMVNNAIMVFKEMDRKQLRGAGVAFSMMLFYISYEIEVRSAFQNEQ